MRRSGRKRLDRLPPDVAGAAALPRDLHVRGQPFEVPADHAACELELVSNALPASEPKARLRPRDAGWAGRRYRPADAAADHLRRGAVRHVRTCAAA